MFDDGTNTSDCTACLGRCKSCETTEDNCTTCAGIRVSKPGCVCPYGTVDVNGKCETCAYNCETCHDGNVSTCLLCKTGRENAPHCTCPVGQFENS